MAWKHGWQAQDPFRQCDDMPMEQKKWIKFLILATLVKLNFNNLAIESFNKFLELKEILRNFRFVVKQVNLGEFTIVINETNIIFFRPKESMAEAHTSENTSSKGADEWLDETGKGNWWALAQAQASHTDSLHYRKSRFFRRPKLFSAVFPGRRK
jgi:hypothetical protein